MPSSWVLVKSPCVCRTTAPYSLQESCMTSSFLIEKSTRGVPEASMWVVWVRADVCPRALSFGEIFWISRCHKHMVFQKRPGQTQSPFGMAKYLKGQAVRHPRPTKIKPVSSFKKYKKPVSVVFDWKRHWQFLKHIMANIKKIASTTTEVRLDKNIFHIVKKAPWVTHLIYDPLQLQGCKKWVAEDKPWCFGKHSSISCVHVIVNCMCL